MNPESLTILSFFLISGTAIYITTMQERGQLKGTNLTIGISLLLITLTSCAITLTSIHK